MMRAGVRMRVLSLVTLLGVAVVTVNVGLVGVAAADAPDCSIVSYSGDGSSSNPYQVGTVDQLQCIETQGLGADYVLTTDIDALGTTSWNGGDGFEPIGDSTNQFTGTFDGGGYAISGLVIDRPTENDVGLFSYVGSSGSVTNVTLENVDVHGNGEYPTGVGGLAGQSDGTLTNVTVGGTVVAEKYRVGGVAGIVGSGGTLLALTLLAQRRE